jgi:colanic acid/amylovoran biosynthesis protein
MNPVDTQPKGDKVVALLGASFNSGNHGVGALASGTLSALLHAQPEARLVFLDYAREAVAGNDRVGERAVRVEMINLRFSKKPWQENHIARLLLLALWIKLMPSGVRRRIVQGNSWLRDICGTRVCLSIAGGDSFSDIYGMQRLLYVALPQVLVLLLGKPLVLMPQTYGPFKSPLARALAGWIFKRASAIYSRDQEGLQTVRQLAGAAGGRARFAYDMGFALEPLPPADDVRKQLEVIQQNGPMVGLNVSGLLYAGGYTRNNMFGLQLDYAALVRSLLDEIIRKGDAQVLLVPHVFGGPEVMESDTAACERIHAEFGQQYAGRLHYLRGNFDQHEIKYIIGRCGFFLGSRMHACIGALSQGVPTVGLAYSRKFVGVLDSIGGGSRVVDLRQLDEAQILAAVREAFAQRDVLRGQLEKKMPAIRQSVSGLFAGDDFKRWLSAG